MKRHEDQRIHTGIAHHTRTLSRGRRIGAAVKRAMDSIPAMLNGAPQEWAGQQLAAIRERKGRA